ncbi:hypothetical protein, partial [Mesorhizobium zhangyense]
QIIRMGTLRFSDGSQTEKAFKRKDGKIVEFSAAMPTGAMLGTRERQRKEKGGGSSVSGASNSSFAEMLNAVPARNVKARRSKGGKSYRRTEAAKMLAQAYGNTPLLPKITKCPTGLPYAPARVADLFLGMKKGRCAGGGAPSWQDDCSGLASREEWRNVRSEMLEADVQVIDAAMKAKNLGDIGRAMGHSGAYAEKAGKRLLRVANDNLAAVIKKIAA